MNYEKFSSISAALSSLGLVGLSINSLHIVRRKRNISTGLDENYHDDIYIMMKCVCVCVCHVFAYFASTCQAGDIYMVERDLPSHQHVPSFPCQIEGSVLLYF